MNISTFVNTDIFPYPPKDINKIFYTDKITIRAVKNNSLNLGSDNKKLNNSKAILTQKQFILNFLPIISLNKNLAKYIPITYNKNLIINIPNTDIILNKLSWNKILNIFSIH